MNLVLVASHTFSSRAINLIGSFKKWRHGGRIFYFHFGPFPSGYFEAVRSYHPEVLFHEVPKACPHAYDPGIWFFKNYALLRALEIVQEAFIYSDAANIIVGPLDGLERRLIEKSRVFVAYPSVPYFRNENWTTEKAIKKAGFDASRFREAPQYWAGLQAYTATTENAEFIREMYRLMLDPEVAGPSGKISKPEPGTRCLASRGDQSILSLLIEARGWHQPFDPEFFLRYGDMHTIERCAPSFLSRFPPPAVRPPPSIVTRQRRSDFVPEGLIPWCDARA